MFTISTLGCNHRGCSAAVPNRPKPDAELWPTAGANVPMVKPCQEADTMTGTEQVRLFCVTA